MNYWDPVVEEVVEEELGLVALVAVVEEVFVLFKLTQLLEYPV